MRVLIASLLLLSASCTRMRPAAPGEPSSAAPEAPVARPLSYTQPATATLAYEFADTSTSDIQAGAAGAIRVSTGASGIQQLSRRGSGRGHDGRH
jgi:hypothetical protein